MQALQTGNLVPEILQLRSQGLTDNLIVQELQGRGYPQQQIEQALYQADAAASSGARAAMPAYAPPRAPAAPMSSEDSNIYERIEEIAESIIDEKWDELIAEVKKIIEWKEKIEEKQNKIIKDVIPEFVENVKELKGITERQKK